MVEAHRLGVHAGLHDAAERLRPMRVGTRQPVERQVAVAQRVVGELVMIGLDRGVPVAAPPVQTDIAADEIRRHAIQAVAEVLQVVLVADPAEVAGGVPGFIEVVRRLQPELAAVAVGQTALRDRLPVRVDVTARIIFRKLVGRHPRSGHLAAALRIQPPELAAQQHAAFGHEARGQGGVVIGGEVEVDRLPVVEPVAPAQSDRGVQQSGATAVIGGERDPRDVKHRHLADPDGGVAGRAHAAFGIDVDPLRTQFPRTL